MFVLKTIGWLNPVLRLWFILIGISTVFTYQQHVLDIVTSWILAIAVLRLIAPETASADPARGVRNGRVGSCYATGSALLLGLAWALWPWGALLLWPACALAVTAAGYFYFGSIVYRKLRGRVAFSTRALLGPVLLGQYGSLVYYRFQCRAWDEVMPGVLLGRRLGAAEARQAIAAGVTAVLDLTAEFSEARPLLATVYRNIQVLDLTAPSPAQLDEAATFIDTHRQGGKVYVHCKAGYSRSGAAVGAYLLKSGQAADVDEVLAMLRRARPSIIVRPEARGALRAYQQALAMHTTASQEPASHKPPLSSAGSS